jgi:hypothetical protein
MPPKDLMAREPPVCDKQAGGFCLMARNPLKTRGVATDHLQSRHAPVVVVGRDPAGYKSRTTSTTSQSKWVA